MNFFRVPFSENKSLKAYNAVDEHLLQYYNENLVGKSITLYNDRYGYLTTNLLKYSNTIIERKSQIDAISLNVKKEFKVQTIEKNITDRSQVILIHLPKSHAHLEKYLSHAAEGLTTHSQIIIGYHTRHFSKNLIKIAEKYAANIHQTLTWKKSKLLVLKNLNIDESHSIQYERKLNVKSSETGFAFGKIDKGTSFLLENIEIYPKEINILDIGTGNGIIPSFIHHHYSSKKIVAIEDDLLSVLASQENLQSTNTKVLWDYKIETTIGQFDLIVSNPPFHSGFEVDFSLPFQLIKQAHSVLRSGGRILLVGNQHINYGVELHKLGYQQINKTAQNNSFIVWEAYK